MHTAFGFSFIGLALVVLLCSLVHDAAPSGGRLCAAMRAVHAFAWLLPGGMTIMMCVMLHAMSNERGLHHEMDEHDVKPRTTMEAVCMYNAMVFLACAVHLAVLILGLPRSDAPPARAVAHRASGVEMPPSVDAEPEVEGLLMSKV